MRRSPLRRKPPELLAHTGAHALGGDLFVDGALGSHTAALVEPYHDCAGRHGNRYLASTGGGARARLHPCRDPGGLPRDRRRRDPHRRRGVRDRRERTGRTCRRRARHRLEHLEMVTPEQAALLGSWGVIASMQPVFDALWGGTEGMYAQRLGARAGPRA
ncbi:amidohydrolase family protein [Rhodococcus hoagii]|nr:amidohydrolase family protein [Prescottella equi]